MLLFFVEEYNIETKCTLWPILYPSRPFRFQILCTLARSTCWFLETLSLRDIIAQEIVQIVNSHKSLMRRSTFFQVSNQTSWIEVLVESSCGYLHPKLKFGKRLNSIKTWVSLKSFLLLIVWVTIWTTVPSLL